MRRDKTGDRSPTLTSFAAGRRDNGAVRFERYHRSRRAIFDAELAKNMLDMFADRAGLCAENNSDIVVTFAPRNPEENLGFAGRQLERRESLDAALILVGHGIHRFSC